MGNIIRPISDTIIAPRKSISKDLMTRYRDSLILLEALIKATTDSLMRGAVDSVVSGTITDINPTAGSIQHDNEYNGLYLHFTSGAVFVANSLNRYKITGTNFTNKTISVAENLVTAGVMAGDTYEILGHTHDGDASNPDGAKIDLKNLANILRGQLMTQDIADAITDPNNVRGGVASATFPFITNSATLLNCKAVTYQFGGDSVNVNLTHNLNRTVLFIKTRVLSFESGANGFKGDHSAVWFPDLTTKGIGRRKTPNSASDASTSHNTFNGTNGAIAGYNVSGINGNNSDLRITAASNTQLTLQHSGGGGSHNYFFLFEVH